MTTMTKGKSTVELLGETSILVTRRFAARREMVFDTMTKPDLIRRWLLGPDGWTMEACEVDLRPGGNYRFYWQHSDGRELQMTGTYIAINPPVGFSSSRRFDLGYISPEEHFEYTLEEDGDQTLMRAVMTYETRELRDQAINSGMTNGMERSYERMDEIFA